MLYLRFTPVLDASRLLDDLQRARETLDRYQDSPDAYMGELRRHAIALSVHYSTRIEGNRLTLEQVESLLRGRQIAAPISQQQEALNYREAMQYAQVVANASFATHLTEETVKTIHFLVTKSLPGGYNPGQYRFVQNFVINSATQRPLFRPPPPDRVQPLMEEYVQWLNMSREGLPPYYRAALAHLNFVAIHPFDDGNGRTARILEALVLYLAGCRSQELVSLEAYFGRDTQGYYRAIAASLGPAYDPQDRDVTPWTDYYLRAHAAQATVAVAETRLHREQIDRLERSIRSAVERRPRPAHRAVGRLSGWPHHERRLSGLRERGQSDGGETPARDGGSRAAHPARHRPRHTLRPHRGRAPRLPVGGGGDGTVTPTPCAIARSVVSVMYAWPSGARARHRRKKHG